MDEKEREEVARLIRHGVECAKSLIFCGQGEKEDEDFVEEGMQWLEGNGYDAGSQWTKFY